MKLRFLGIISLGILFVKAAFAEGTNQELSLTLPCREAAKNSCYSSCCLNYPDQELEDTCPAYNFPANIDTYGSHFFADVSFLYWYISQNYMDYGRSALYGGADGSTPAPSASIAEQKFHYSPGFQVGLGYTSDYDAWEVQAEFTYLHHESSNQVGSVPSSISTGQKIWVPNEWFLNLSSTIQQQAVQMNSEWKMHLEYLDFYLSRAFYQGTHLIVTPHAGLRTLWLREQFQVKAFLATALTSPPATSLTQSKAWAIGPTFGSDFNWLLGKGVRLETDLGFSLLYTRYSNLKHTESFNSSITGTTPIDGEMDPSSALSPIAQARLGIGWGTYCSQDRLHVDFSASYDFALLWEQNKLREMVGYFANNSIGYSNPIGDLSLHGLTLKGRLDF